MEENGGAGFHFTIDEFEPFKSGLDAFGIGAGLIADGAVIHAAQAVGTTNDLEAAIFARGGIDGDHATGEVGRETAVVVPVAIVLMPSPGSASVGFLEDHLVVVVVDFVFEDLFDRFDDSFETNDGSVDVGGDFVFDFETDGSSLAVSAGSDFLLELMVASGDVAEESEFLGGEELGDDDEAIAVEIGDLLRGEAAG